MSYQLPSDVEKLLEDRMKLGGYASKEDVLRDALRALEEISYFQPNPRATRISSLESLRLEIKRGLDQLDRGEGKDAEEVFDELLRDLPDDSRE